MKLLGPPENSTLTTLGLEATDLLLTGRIDALADRFGYALSYGRERADAIREDLALTLNEFGAASLPNATTQPSVDVKYFGPNDTGLVGLIKCRIPTNTRAHLLIELVLSGDPAAPYVTLEQISGFA